MRGMLTPCPAHGGDVRGLGRQALHGAACGLGAGGGHTWTAAYGAQRELILAPRPAKGRRGHLDSGSGGALGRGVHSWGAAGMWQGWRASTQQVRRGNGGGCISDTAAGAEQAPVDSRPQAVLVYSAGVSIHTHPSTGVTKLMMFGALTVLPFGRLATTVTAYCTIGRRWQVTAMIAEDVHAGCC